DGSAERVEPADAMPEFPGTRLFSLDATEGREAMAVLAAGRGATDDRPAPAPPKDEPFLVAECAAGAQVVVHLLGTYRIEVDGEEIKSGFRTKARELLAFLLLHPEGKTVEAAVDAIWPDADPARGTEGFRTAVGNLRTVLRKATRNPKAPVIQRI